MARPVLAQGRVGVRSQPRRVPLGDSGGERGFRGATHGGQQIHPDDAGKGIGDLDVMDDIDIIEELERQGIDWSTASHGDPEVEKAKEKVRGRKRPTIPMAEFDALPSADRAMLTHAASGEPPRLGRAHPERPSGSPPYEPVPELPPEQMERNREGVRRARETLRNPPADMPLPKGDQGSLMEAPDMGNMMASYESMLDSLPDRAAAALQRRQSTAVGHEATSGGNPLGNAPDWLDEVLLMIAAGGAATLLPPVGGAALLGGAAMLAQ